VTDIILENNVPLPDGHRKKTLKNNYRYEVFDTMDVGQSFMVEGDAEKLKSFRAVVRARNMRMKGQAKFFWDYTDPSKSAIRVWRIE